MTEYVCLRCQRIVDRIEEPGGHEGRCPDCAGQVDREERAS